MCQIRRALILSLAVLLASIANADTITLHDNGDVVEADLGLRFNHANWSVYDNFFLSGNSVVTSFRWAQFDEDVNYAGTILTIFSALPTPENLVAVIDAKATRTANGMALSTDKVASGAVIGFDYAVDGLTLNLNSGEYFLGIWNDVSGGATLIANSLGSESAEFGFWQHNGGEPPTFGLTESGPEQFNNSNIPFAVHGYLRVPEPGTLLLLIAGLLGIRWTGSRTDHTRLY